MSESAIGREPITIVEIDQDICALDYGTAPCTAALGVTGVRKCFKTNPTCQDPANFDRGVLTLRFCVAASNLPRDVVLIPSIAGVTTVPTEVNIGGVDGGTAPLGRRASVTITLRDHPHHDRGVDPYALERDYEAIELGTFWSKWLARNRYYAGRPLRVLSGYVGQALGDMRVRHYVIEKIDGPSAGRVTIIAKDPIKLLELPRAQVPFPNIGVLSADIDEAATLITLKPAGIGDQEYDAAGLARFGSEIVSFVRTGDLVTLTSRGLHNTEIGTAKAGDAFQQVVYYKNRRVDAVLDDLLQRAGFPAAFYDPAAWAAEVELWSMALSVTRLIAEPTAVEDLIGGVVQQTLCTIWWDELTQDLKLKVLRPRLVQIDDDPPALTAEAHIVAERFAITDKPADRISQVWIYYDKIDPTAGDDDRNYARLRVVSDAAAEGADQYNEQRIYKMFAPWLASGNDAAAHAIAVRRLRAFRDTPKLYTWSVDIKDHAIKAVDFVRMTHPAVVDFTGAPLAFDLQVASVEEVERGHRMEMTGRPAIAYVDNAAFIEPDGSPDYTAATGEQKAMGCWIADAAGELSNGDGGYRII